ncbi:WD repeat protein Rrb1 [Taphrina deformans PYCC 5710]|uniref:Glutamate-rich WD repeat-containing protein 1 n=1 Tax=Taphrina deformans (strain PYCC 5710 / ATCC 11124 / CBS 356.35 / IMI 108563 / JCM 9778 / NBRC 8474) TaxID=1097556 RepID=R4XBB0_TAPDE|nr:WD repeat protein Rrb1 [Taphrina deformans PYCC 5710]|eukprot:CCG81641.1 WD repeat protein Rrb1 [Taphrina deformans PYCC 5710]
MSKRDLDENQLLPVKNGDRPQGEIEVDFSDEDSDDFESDDEDEIFQQSDEEDGDAVMTLDDQKAQVWLPGTQLAQNEVLEADQSAYELLHNINVKWPCLTFDILWDKLGEERRTYPATCYVVTGTQADESKHNEIQVIKCSNLVKTQVDDNSSVSSAESNDDEPELSYRAIPVVGGTNRIRATQARDQPHLVASMNESGHVYIHNIEAHIQSLDSNTTNTSILKDASLNRPIHTIKSHASEGYALDWSPLIPGKLITGDNDGRIYVTTRNDDGSFTTDSRPFTGHAGSVEDLQWSPSEKTVFASCSSDGTLKIWDTRSKKRSAALTVKAHETDVNVISWNPTVNYLIASGSDDGQISIWDLRTFSQQTAERPATPAASFSWHRQAITSIQWHPTDESVLVASGADDQVTLWDLSVELDAEEQAAKQSEGMGDVPSQLMFVHMGQKDIKEVRWHRQLPGVILSTALTGFNVFKSAHQS